MPSQQESSRKESRLAREGQPRFLLNIPITSEPNEKPTPDQLRWIAHRIRAEFPPASPNFMVQSDVVLYKTIDSLIESINKVADELEESQTITSDSP